MIGMAISKWWAEAQGWERFPEPQRNVAAGILRATEVVPVSWSPAWGCAEGRACDPAPVRGEPQDLPEVLGCCAAGCPPASETGCDLPDGPGRGQLLQNSSLPVNWKRRFCSSHSTSLIKAFAFLFDLVPVQTRAGRAAATNSSTMPSVGRVSTSVRGGRTGQERWAWEHGCMLHKSRSRKTTPGDCGYPQFAARVRPTILGPCARIRGGFQ